MVDKVMQSPKHPRFIPTPMTLPMPTPHLGYTFSVLESLLVPPGSLPCPCYPTLISLSEQPQCLWSILDIIIEQPAIFCLSCLFSSQPDHKPSDGKDEAIYFFFYFTVSSKRHSILNKYLLIHGNGFIVIRHGVGERGMI